MFIKTYTYYILPESENEYLKIQEKAAKIYAEYSENQIFLKSREENAKWTELHFFRDKAAYFEGMERIDSNEIIQELYKEFLKIIVSEKGVREESFDQANFMEG